MRRVLTVIGSCAGLLAMSCGGAPDRVRAAAPERPGAAKPGDRAGVGAEDLLRRPVTVRSYSGTIAGLVDELVERQRVPLSYVGVPKEPRVGIDLEAAPLGVLLDEVLGQAPGYRYEAIRGRLVLYPKDDLFQKTLQGVRIASRERSAAANELIPLLRGRFAALRDWRGLVAVGDFTTPLFTDKVTLPDRGRVIDLLLGLLGDDKALVLTVCWSDTYSGMILGLDRVDEPRRAGA